MAHLPAVRDVLTIGLKQVEESGDVFVGPVVSLLNAIAQVRPATVSLWADGGLGAEWLAARAADVLAGLPCTAQPPHRRCAARPHARWPHKPTATRVV